MKKLFKVVSAAVIAVSSLALAGVPALAQTDGFDYGDPTTTYDDYYTTSIDDAEAGGIFAGIGLVIWLVICCVGLLVAAGLAYLVYSDAKKNNVENGTLWAILTFFFGIIPLLIYFLAIKKSSGGNTAAK